jgi:hypothetical protein
MVGEISLVVNKIRSAFGFFTFAGLLSKSSMAKVVYLLN